MGELNSSEKPNKSDLIERQAAIDDMRKQLWYRMQPNDSFRERMEAWINNLPSAQPEIVRCRECKYADWYTTIEGKKLCFCIETDTGGRTEEDYCSLGEREEDG